MCSSQRKKGDSEHTVSLQFLVIWLQSESGTCLGNIKREKIPGCRTPVLILLVLSKAQRCKRPNMDILSDGPYFYELGRWSHSCQVLLYVMSWKGSPVHSNSYKVLATGMGHQKSLRLQKVLMDRNELK